MLLANLGDGAVRWHRVSFKLSLDFTSWTFCHRIIHIGHLQAVLTLNSGVDHFLLAD